VCTWYVNKGTPYTNLRHPPPSTSLTKLKQYHGDSTLMTKQRRWYSFAAYRHQTSLMTRVIIGVVFMAGGTFVFDYLRTPNMMAIIGWTEYPTAGQCTTTKEVCATITNSTPHELMALDNVDVSAPRWWRYTTITFLSALLNHADDQSSKSRKEHIQVARNNTIAGIESIHKLIILIAAASYC
jgi:hypothetical protein